MGSWSYRGPPWPFSYFSGRFSSKFSRFLSKIGKICLKIAKNGHFWPIFGPKRNFLGQNEKKRIFPGPGFDKRGHLGWVWAIIRASLIQGKTPQAGPNVQYLVKFGSIWASFWSKSDHLDQSRGSFPGSKRLNYSPNPSQMTTPTEPWSREDALLLILAQKIAFWAKNWSKMAIFGYF